MSISGLNINPSKSSIWFSPNTPSHIRDNASQMLGFRECSNPGPYLGIPSGISGRKKDFDCVMEKISKRITSWKGKYLSQKGKSVLIRSVCSSISAFYMQCLPIPKGVCEEIDKRLRHFSRCQAFMGKLYWRMLQENNSPWAIISNHRFLKNAKNSIVNKCLSGGKTVFNLGSKFVIHSGNQTCLWHDRWLPQGKLRDLLAGPLLNNESSLTVVEAMDNAGNWNWNIFFFPIPPHISCSMLSIPRNPSGGRPDILSWNPNSDGKYSLKSAYFLLTQDESRSRDSLKWIWKLQCHPRHHFFLLAYLAYVSPTNSLISSRGINTSPLCPLCGSQDESIEHLFRSCSSSNLIWNQCSSRPTSFSSTSPFLIWFKNCAICQDPTSFNIPFGTLFIYCLWNMWLSRNKKVFQCVPFFHKAVYKEALQYAVEYFHLGNSHMSSKSQTSSVLVSWQPPDEGWLKINVDGACDPLSHDIAVGGLIRDHIGNWVLGFYKFLGSGDSFLAEVWGVLLGLQLAVSINASFVWLESDCVHLVNLFNDSSPVVFHHIAPLIDNCRSYLSHLRRFKFTHVLREGNQVADALAGHALLSKCNLVSNSVCPSFTSVKFAADLFGIQTPRGIG